MARSLRDLRRKMKAIKSTRQVTKAMELVAASKMRRAVQNAVILRRYALSAYGLLRRLAVHHPGTHAFLTQSPSRKILCIVLTTDRGLCGSLNAQLFRSLQKFLKDIRSIPTFEVVDFVAVGRKGQQFLARTGNTVIAAFPAMNNNPVSRDIRPLATFVTEQFTSRAYDHILLVYPDFVSPLVQEPMVRMLLPFTEAQLEAMLATSGKNQRTAGADLSLGEPHRQYMFEPSPEVVLSAILQQLTEVQLYQAVLETAASEHSARMVAMRSASDSATDLLGDLTLTYNQTRQAAITSELAELSGARAAMA